MDKQTYKEMLAHEAIKFSELENEINRLQILVAKYSDQQREITKIVKICAAFRQIIILIFRGKLDFQYIDFRIAPLIF